MLVISESFIGNGVAWPSGWTVTAYGDTTGAGGTRQKNEGRLRTGDSGSGDIAVALHNSVSVADGEILVKIGASDIADGGLGIAFRVDGIDGTYGYIKNGVELEIFPGFTTLYEYYDNGSTQGYEYSAQPVFSSTLDRKWIRVKFQGTDVKWRWWTVGDSEPGTWTQEIELEHGATAAGSVALLAYGSASAVNYDAFFDAYQLNDGAATVTPSTLRVVGGWYTYAELSSNYGSIGAVNSAYDSYGDLRKDAVRAVNVATAAAGTVAASDCFVIAGVPSPAISRTATVAASAVSVATAVPVPSVSDSAIVTVAATSVVAASPSVSISCSATVAASTVSAVSALPSLNISDLESVAASTVFATIAVASPTISCSETVAVSATAAVIAVSSPSISRSTTMDAAAVSILAAVYSPGISRSETVTTSTVPVVGVTAAPSISRSTTVAASTVLAVAAAPSSNIYRAETVTTTQVGAVVAVNPVGLDGDAAAVPVAAPAEFQVYAPDIATTASSSVSTVESAIAASTPSISGSVQFDGMSIDVAVEVEPATVSATATTLLGEVACAVSPQSVVVSTGATAFPEVTAVAVSSESPDVANSATAVVSALSLVATVGDANIETDATALASATSVNSVISSPTLLTEGSVTISATRVVASLLISNAQVGASVEKTADAVAITTLTDSAVIACSVDASALAVASDLSVSGPDFVIDETPQVERVETIVNLALVLGAASAEIPSSTCEATASVEIPSVEIGADAPLSTVDALTSIEEAEVNTSATVFANSIAVALAVMPPVRESRTVAVKTVRIVGGWYEYDELSDEFETNSDLESFPDYDSILLPVVKSVVVQTSVIESATVLPSPVDAVFGVPDPAVITSVDGSATVLPSLVDATFSVPTPVVTTAVEAGQTGQTGALARPRRSREKPTFKVGRSVSIRLAFSVRIRAIPVAISFRKRYFNTRPLMTVAPLTTSQAPVPVVTYAVGASEIAVKRSLHASVTTSVGLLPRAQHEIAVEGPRFSATFPHSFCTSIDERLHVRDDEDEIMALLAFIDSQ